MSSVTLNESSSQFSIVDEKWDDGLTQGLENFYQASKDKKNKPKSPKKIDQTVNNLGTTVSKRQVAFDKNRLDKYKAYRLREATPQAPGIIIEAHQAKHSVGWPGGNPGGKGTRFGLGLDNTIQLADAIVDGMPILKTQPTQENRRPSLLTFPIERDNVGDDLFKKLKDVQSIAVYAAFSTQQSSWEVHFYPNMR